MSKSKSNSDLEEIRILLKGIQTSLNGKATKEQIDLLMEKINEKEEKINHLENEILEIKDKLDMVISKNVILTKTVDLLDRKADDNESYLRRQCLRVTGISEDKNEDGENSLKKVKREIKKLGIDVKDCEFDRAHRIGRAIEGRERAIIVKFTTWRVRTAVYKKRKKNGKIRFYPDLTKRRFKLLMDAQDLTKENGKIDFVFSDTNNNICLRTINGAVRLFNSMAELEKILAEFEISDE